MVLHNRHLAINFEISFISQAEENWKLKKKKYDMIEIYPGGYNYKKSNRIFC